MRKNRIWNRSGRIAGAMVASVAWVVAARVAAGQSQGLQPMDIGGPMRGATPAMTPAAPPAAPAATPANQTAIPGNQAAPPTAASPAGAGASISSGASAGDPGAQPAASPVAPAVATPATPVEPAGPAAGEAAPAVDEGTAYTLTGVKIDYRDVHPQQPPIEQLLNSEVRLGVAGDGYVAVRPGVSTVMVKLGEIGKSGPQKIYRSGIRAIYNHIVRFYNSRGIIGVFVVVDASDIDVNDTDIRPPERTTLQFVVVTSTVKQVRTVAIGENSTDANRVDDPRHAFIRRHSPLQPTPEAAATAPAASAPAAAGARMDLLKKDALDDYVLRLNRQPGRRVDVAVSGTGEPGQVTLDYLVSESRPWYVYGQISNTGTEQTNTWRERFGFVHNQLTGRDDVLSLDYLTAGFEDTNAVIASYELPFFTLERLRYKVYASWNQYTSSDVGQNDEEFTGDTWTVGNELIANVYQHRELFLDLVGGLRFQSIRTDNITSDTQGKAGYFEPYLSLRLERATDIATTLGSVNVLGGITSANGEDLEGLGRAEPTRNPVVLQFDIAQTFYLEPLLMPGEFASGGSTLAHELYLSTRGQWAFHNRLVPQFQDVAGGLYSVRGYPESIVAGDSVIIATAEYRFHVPRIFAVQSDPSATPFLWDKNFRFAPQHAYGRPDWDLILRGFVDAARVVNSSKQPFENDATLVGAGVGVELQYKQNFNVRVDWGAALTGIEDEVDAGSNRFHISSTILY